MRHLRKESRPTVLKNGCSPSVGSCAHHDFFSLLDELEVDEDVDDELPLDDPEDESELVELGVLVLLSEDFAGADASELASDFPSDFPSAVPSGAPSAVFACGFPSSPGRLGSLSLSE